MAADQRISYVPVEHMDDETVALLATGGGFGETRAEPIGFPADDQGRGLRPRPVGK